MRVHNYDIHKLGSHYFKGVIEKLICFGLWINIVITHFWCETRLPINNGFVGIVWILQSLLHQILSVLSGLWQMRKSCNNRRAFFKVWLCNCKFVSKAGQEKHLCCFVSWLKFFCSHWISKQPAKNWKHTLFRCRVT